MPPHVFAVGPDRIAYGRFERSGGGFAVTSYHVRPLPPDTFIEGLLGGPLKEPTVFREVLADLLTALPAPVKGASLVLPDAWMRIAYAGGGDLPRDTAQRQEVLRWKLKRLVPFRVEELRVEGREVSPLADGEPRLLLGFALESLVEQVEEAFDEAGIRLGHITNESLAALAAVAEADPSGGLNGVAVVSEDGYTLLFARGEEPLLYRYKGGLGDVAPAARPGLVVRDLRLTRSFLAEQLAGAEPGRVVLVSEPQVEAEWMAWLADGFGRSPERLAPAHLPSLQGAPNVDLAEMVPLLGAAAGEVA